MIKHAIVATAIVTLLSACGGSDSDEPALWQVSLKEPSSAPLKTVGGEGLTRYLKNGLYAQAHLNATLMVDPGVTDRLPLMTNDADRLAFMVSTVYLAGIDDETEQPHIKRWQRNADGSLLPLTDLAISPAIHTIEGLYADQQQLAVIGRKLFGVNVAETEPHANMGYGAVTVQMFEQDKAVFTVKFDGALLQSQRTDDALWLVTQFSPSFNGFKIVASSEDELRQNIRVLEAATLNELLPKRIINNNPSEPLIAASHCYLPSDAQQNEGTQLMTFITRISTSAPYETETTCVVSSNSTRYTSELYLSSDNLYLYGSYNDSSQSFIHKFRLNDLSYQATGEVDGFVPGAESAVLLHERGDHLMLFTSEFSADGPLHNFIVLEQQEGILNKVSQLQNPELTIGDAENTVFRVHYKNDRAYVVTDDSAEPLYMLDISNPEQPVVLGELDVPGYSAYLHNVTDNLLFGLDQHIRQDEFSGDIDWTTAGAKFSIFDVSSEAEVLMDQQAYSAQYSVVEFQPHSVTLQKTNGLTRLALPLSREDATIGQQHSLLLLEISENGMMQQIGEIVPLQTKPTSSWDARSLLIEDDVYFVLGDSIYHSNWQQPEQVIAEYN